MTFGQETHRCLLAAIVLILGMALGHSGQAQVGISTFELDLQVPPGGTVVDSVSVVNSSEVLQAVTMDLVDWIPSGPGTQKYLPPGTLERSVCEWVSFFPSEATIEPGGTAQVRVEVSAPAEAEGEYWGMLFVRLAGASPAAVESQTVSRVGMQVVLGVAIYVDVGGGDPSGRIVSLSAIPADSVRQRLLKLEFEDTGITRLHIVGRVEIADANGKTVRTIALPEFVSLPNTRQTVELPLTRPPSETPGPQADKFEGDPPLVPGSYVAIAVIDYGGDSLVAAQLPFVIEEEMPEE